MKTKPSLSQFTTWCVLLACVVSSVSCMTTYDAYGRRMETVDPGLAVAGIATAGLIGYVAANHHSHHHDDDHDDDDGGDYDGGRYDDGDDDYHPCH